MRIVDMLVVRAQNAWFGFRDEESGQTLVEYALIIAVVGLGVIFALVILRDQIANLFKKTGSSLEKLPSSGG